MSGSGLSLSLSEFEGLVNWILFLDLQLFSKVGGKMSNLSNILAVMYVTWIGPQTHCLVMWIGGIFYLCRKPACHRHPQLGTLSLRMSRPFPFCWQSDSKVKKLLQGKSTLKEEKSVKTKELFFYDQTLEPGVCWFFEEHASKAWPGGLWGHWKKALSISIYVWIRPHSLRWARDEESLSLIVF